LLCRRYFCLPTLPNLQSGLLDRAGERKRQRPWQSRLEFDIQGIQAGRGQFSGLTAGQECIPGTAADTALSKHRTVVAATSRTSSCLRQVNPGSTMLGFRIMPSNVTRYV
jgi:hypothetical protein